MRTNPKGSASEISCAACRYRQKSMFSELAAEELAALDADKSCMFYRKGQTLFHEGARPLGIFCMNSGKVKVFKLGTNGKEQIIYVHSSGDLLGYRTMLAEENYSVTAETLEDCSICYIPKQHFLNMIAENPLFHHKITKELGKELGSMMDEMTSMAQRTVRERLALTLLALKDTYRLNGHDDGPVDIALSREDLANIVGTATENLIRILHDFKEDRLVESKGRTIRVMDARGLADVAGGR